MGVAPGCRGVCRVRGCPGKSLSDEMVCSGRERNNTSVGASVPGQSSVVSATHIIARITL